MDSARRFLDRFRNADAAGSPLSAFVDDPDGLGAVLAREPEALGEALSAATAEGQGPPVILNDDCFVSAACDRHGTVVVSGARFEAWFDGIDPFGAVVRNMHGERPNVSLLADDRNGRPVALAAGSLAVSRHWPLDEAVRTALTTRRADYALVAFRPGRTAWLHAAQAYGLTDAETGLVAALARHGDLQRAASERGVAYETARKFVAAAMRKTGSARQTELIRKTLMLAAGDVPDSARLATQVRDLFGLTARQADLAVLVAAGATRDNAAKILGISEHRAKSDLKIVFQSCGVTNAVDLARIIAEIDALMGLASACDVTITTVGEPVKLVSRRWAPGKIAVADHGPPTAKPVLIFHSSVSGRHHSRSFISALRNAGYRPIVIERAGFGLSAAAPGDPVSAGAADVRDVVDSLTLDAPLVVARCNLASHIAASAAAEGLIAGGVLVGAEAPSCNRADRTRMTDRGRAIFARYPALAEALVKVLARRTNAASIEKLWRKAAEGDAIDLAILDQPDELADIVHGAKQASVGVTGFLNEALALGRDPVPANVVNAARFTLLWGTGHARYDIEDAIAFWSGAMPAAHIDVVDDGVHFLHVTHVDHVIAALDRAYALA
jgi:DNA-binding CsgD family transcriptional regulator